MKTSRSASSSRRDADSCWVCVPVVGEELTATVRRLGEVLLTLEGWEAHGGRLPEPLAGRKALDSVGRVYQALAPAQARPDRPEVFSADCVRQYPPVWFAELAPDDVEMLGAAVAQFQRALAPSQPRPVDDTEEVLGDALSDHRRAGETLLTLVGQVDRLSRLLEIGWNADLELVHSRLIQDQAADGTPGQETIELTPVEEVAYQRIVQRLTAIWADGAADPGPEPELDEVLVVSRSGHEVPA